MLQLGFSKYESSEFPELSADIKPTNIALENELIGVRNSILRNTGSSLLNVTSIVPIVREADGANSIFDVETTWWQKFGAYTNDDTTSATSTTPTDVSPSSSTVTFTVGDINQNLRIPIPSSSLSEGNTTSRSFGALTNNAIISDAISDNTLLPTSATAENKVEPKILVGAYNKDTGHYYCLLPESTWTEAQAQAVALGGNLVTFGKNDAKEESWVYSKFSNYAGANKNLWIGLYDPDPVNNSKNRWERRLEFEWVDKRAVSYEHWSPVEPNNPKSGDPNTNLERYVHIWNPSDPHKRKWNNAEDVSRVFGVPVHGVVEIIPPLTDISDKPSFGSAKKVIEDYIRKNPLTIFEGLEDGLELVQQARRLDPSGLLLGEIASSFITGKAPTFPGTNKKIPGLEGLEGLGGGALITSTSNKITQVIKEALGIK